jgi:hypothetical protein
VGHLLVVEMSMRLLPLMLAALTLAPAARASVWSRAYDGAASYEMPLDAVELADGTFVMAGVNDSFGTHTGDAWLVHLDADGLVLSEHVLGNPTIGGVDAALALPDGGAVFSGRNVIDLFQIHHAWIVRSDASGAVTWSLLLSTPVGRHFLMALAQSRDGGFIAAGSTGDSDAAPIFAWLVKLGPDGQLEWQRQFGGGGVESVRSVIATRDGGYVMVGVTSSAGAGSTDAWVAKADAAGTLLWQRAFGARDQDEASGATELADGGLAIAGSTNSLTTSGHAPWLLVLEGDGALRWHRVFGADDWGDLGDVTQEPGGGLVAVGRIAEPGASSNDLWLVGVDPADGSFEWQHALAGPSGDWGQFVTPLASGLLVGGAWAWGFPEQATWLARTDALGGLGACPLVRATAISSSAPAIVETDTAYPGSPAAPVEGIVGFAPFPGGASVVTHCFEAPPACDPLGCGVVAAANPACAGQPFVVDVATTGGDGALGFAWDTNGDTLPEALGSPATLTLPAGPATIDVVVTDGCAPPQSCQSQLMLDVLDATPPPEVSDVLAGAPPLLVPAGAMQLVVEEIPEATSYSAYVDVIGSWYAPTTATGSACHVAWASNGDGTVTLDHPLPVNSWVLVTASTRCAEGSPGRDSLGRPRESRGSWARCGPTP